MSEESGGGANGNVAFVKREGVVPARSSTKQHTRQSARRSSPECGPQPAEAACHSPLPGLEARGIVRVQPGRAASGALSCGWRAPGARRVENIREHSRAKNKIDKIDEDPL
jgi:hypothetical protein